MRIKVEILSEPDAAGKPDTPKQTVSVERHSRRGEMFNVDAVDQVVEGNAVMFNVPSAGRLVITTPEAKEEYIYDKEQGAAIRASAQNNTAGVADRADAQELVRMKEKELAVAKAAATAVEQRVDSANKSPAPSASGTEPPKPDLTKAQVDPKTGIVAGTGGKPNTPAQQQNPTAVAAAQQAQPQPAGSKPPLPGSPVGSPPAGNEGKDNK